VPTLPPTVCKDNVHDDEPAEKDNGNEKKIEEEHYPRADANARGLVALHYTRIDSCPHFSRLLSAVFPSTIAVRIQLSMPASGS